MHNSYPGVEISGHPTQRGSPTLSLLLGQGGAGGGGWVLSFNFCSFSPRGYMGPSIQAKFSCKKG